MLFYNVNNMVGVNSEFFYLEYYQNNATTSQFTFIVLSFNGQ